MRYELTTTSTYLREREVLFIKIDMSDYLLEYYHHRQRVAPNTNPEHDAKLKDLLATLAIHLSARPSFETHGWTVHMVSSEPYALYATGNTDEIDEHGVARGYLVGNVLTEHIRHSDTNGIHAQLSSKSGVTQSYVPCESNDVGRIIEAFYRQSEQRPIRIKIAENSDTAVALAALQSYDEEWFNEVELDTLEGQVNENASAPMKSCRFEFRCECTPAKLLPYFIALSDDEIDELYGTDEEIVITCPRCGRFFAIDRRQIAKERAHPDKP